jgi:hypothetical protein
MATQQQTIGDLRAVSAQLPELAERLRASIARFSATQDHGIVADQRP